VQTDELDLAWEGETERGRHRRSAFGGLRGSGNRGTGSRGGKSLLAFVLALAILGGLVGGVWYGFNRVQGFFTAPDYDSVGTGEARIEVRSGDTAADIGQTLVDAKVVKSSRAFIEAAQDEPRSRNVSPGFYKMRLRMSAASALALLLNPASRLVNRVTVPEGLTDKETFAVLAKATGIAAEEFETAAKDPVALGVPELWFTRNDGKEAARSSEGFLFPSTYEVSPGMSATRVLQLMITQFLKVADEISMLDNAQAKGLSPFTSLIAASLAEGEAGTAEDMPKVTRVIYNRLNRKPPMPLEFDSTTNYWRELKGQPRKDNLNDTELLDPTNPYRTYGLAGLPPGPIGNPGRTALLASINPTPGAPWLYFVKIDKSGRSEFTDSFAQHERNIETAKQNGAFD